MKSNKFSAIGNTGKWQNKMVQCIKIDYGGTLIMPPSHWVVCKACGKQFDSESKGGVYDGSRYYCKSCVKKIKKYARANRTVDTAASSNLANGNMSINSIVRMDNGSWFSRNWKILIGIVLLIGGFGNIGEDGGAAIFWILVGAGLIVLFFYPQIKARKLQKAQEAEESNAKEEEIRAIAEEIKHCKTCGARTKGKYCEYCGSKLE